MRITAQLQPSEASPGAARRDAGKQYAYLRKLEEHYGSLDDGLFEANPALTSEQMLWIKQIYISYAYKPDADAFYELSQFVLYDKDGQPFQKLCGIDPSEEERGLGFSNVESIPAERLCEQTFLVNVLKKGYIADETRYKIAKNRWDTSNLYNHKLPKMHD